MVGLDENIMDRFPHELSGGMKQRAVIALALSCDPKLVIADEPTTALDVVIQDQILNEIKKVQDLLGLSLIYISHDIAVIAEMTSTMAVMYAGSVVEMGPTEEIFKNPKHAYTRLLLESTPSVVGDKKKLRSLDGEPPSLIGDIKGCTFSPRCPDPSDDCKNQTLEMELIEISNGHFADICCVNCK
jgi:peptide/nickel transport system ATP-binding protein